MLYRNLCRGGYHPPDICTRTKHKIQVFLILRYCSEVLEDTILPYDAEHFMEELYGK